MRNRGAAKDGARGDRGGWLRGWGAGRLRSGATFDGSCDLGKVPVRLCLRLRLESVRYGFRALTEAAIFPTPEGSAPSEGKILSLERH